MKKLIIYILFLGIVTLLVTATYYGNSYKGYTYESNEKGNNFVNKVEKTEINIKYYEEELSKVQNDIENYPNEKERCDDDVYAFWFMHNEEEFEKQLEIENKNIGIIKPKPPICKPEMIAFYNIYFVNPQEKDTLIEREKQLIKEIQEMKDVYK